MEQITKQVFLGIAAIIRSLPRIRGKVRAGLALYRWLNPRNDNFAVTTTLYPEKLPFELHLTCAHERMAFLMNGYERETSILLERLWSGGAILDIGANVGLVSIPLAHRARERGSLLKVVAIEPVPANVAALRRNVWLNSLEEVISILPVGAGATSKAVLIQVEGGDGRRTGTANILPRPTPLDVPIQIRAIDDLRGDGAVPATVSVLKIDTDGYDLEVMRGAETLLLECRPAVVAECNPVCLGWHEQSLDDVEQFASTVDYQLLLPDRDQAGFHKRASGELNSGDCLLLPTERAVDVLGRVSAAGRPARPKPHVR